MHPELERLIDLALADGKISDKELEVLYRKAIELGVDMDEFEKVLEGRLLRHLFTHRDSFLWWFALLTALCMLTILYNH